jgi:hypothetical protein
MHGQKGHSSKLNRGKVIQFCMRDALLYILYAQVRPPRAGGPAPRAGLSHSLLCLLGHLNVRWNAHAQAAAPVPRR